MSVLRLTSQILAILLAVFLFSCDEEAALDPLRIQEQDDATIQEYLSESGLNATRTESGLYYQITKENPNGLQPLIGDTLAIHYTGWRMYGEIFDSSVYRDRMFYMVAETGQILNVGPEGELTTSEGSVIRGWIEGTVLLKEGEAGRFYLPSHLAYGPRGSGNAIPPNAILIFDIELVEVR